ncbi:hypothetical protein JCM10207_000201 [Rhodosporidiobolus poonsookiae]
MTGTTQHPGSQPSPEPWSIPAAILADLACRTPVFPELLAAHRQAHAHLWGQPNLRNTDGVPHLPLGLQPLLDTFERASSDAPILLRSEYIRKAAAIHELVSCDPSRAWQGFFYVGFPGLGKTTFLLVYALLMAEIRQPFLLASTAHPDLAHLWYSGGVEQVPIRPAWHTPYNFPTFPTPVPILVDAAPAPAGTLGSSDLSASLLGGEGLYTIVSAAAHSERHRWQYNMASYTASQWTEAEARAYLFLHHKYHSKALNNTPHALSAVLKAGLADNQAHLSPSLALNLPTAAYAYDQSTVHPRYQYLSKVQPVHGVLQLFLQLGRCPALFGARVAISSDEMSSGLPAFGHEMWLHPVDGYGFAPVDHGENKVSQVKRHTGESFGKAKQPTNRDYEYATGYGNYLKLLEHHHKQLKSLQERLRAALAAGEDKLRVDQELLNTTFESIQSELDSYINAADTIPEIAKTGVERLFKGLEDAALFMREELAREDIPLGEKAAEILQLSQQHITPAVGKLSKWLRAKQKDIDEATGKA